jgi:hypothetical protein
MEEGRRANRIGAVDIRAMLRPTSRGGWVIETADGPQVRIEAGSREACLAALRDAVRATAGEGLHDASSEEPLTILVEVVPTIAGVAEAAALMGWDKRRVITYIDRGRFPAPLQSLASGRIWLREDLERFARTWRSRRAAPPVGRTRTVKGRR